MIGMLALCVMLGAQPGPLAGPAVGARATRTTLVSYDMNGRLRRPETTPEEAAAGLMGLTPALKSRVDEVLARRAGQIDRFVAENLLMLQELDTAGKAGDRFGQVRLVLLAYHRLKPVLEAGPMEDQVAAALPGSEAGRFRALVDEYWRAAVDEAAADGKAKGKRGPRWAVDLGERLRHLGEEIARSFARQQAAGTLFVDYFMYDLGLTDEQRRTINGLKLDMVERSGGKASEEDQKRLAIGAMAYLNEAQRAKVIARLTGKK
jgi:hypothetical protein